MVPPAPLPRDLRAVFFDIGGTLIGPNLALLGAWLRAAGVETDDAKVAAVEPFARKAQADKRHTMIGTPRLRGLLVEDVIRRLWADQPDDPARLQSAVDRVLANAMASGHMAVPVWNDVLPGVAEGLAALKARGLRLVAVSNSDGSAAKVLESVGLRDVFDHVVDSHLVGFSKPDPRIFETARTLAGVAASQAVHVGDLYEADVIGAQTAGIAAILIDPHGFWPDAPCLRVDSCAAAIAAVTAAGAA